MRRCRCYEPMGTANGELSMLVCCVQGCTRFIYLFMCTSINTSDLVCISYLLVFVWYNRMRWWSHSCSLECCRLLIAYHMLFPTECIVLKSTHPCVQLSRNRDDLIGTVSTDCWSRRLRLLSLPLPLWSQNQHHQWQFRTYSTTLHKNNIFLTRQRTTKRTRQYVRKVVFSISGFTVLRTKSHMILWCAVRYCRG